MFLAALLIIPHCMNSIQVLHCATVPISHRAVPALQEVEVGYPGAHTLYGPPQEVEMGCPSAHTLYELTIISLMLIPRSDWLLSQLKLHYTVLSCPQSLLFSCSSPVPVVGVLSQTPKPPCLNIP